MRVVTFNILNGRAPDESQVDVDTFAAAIAALDADVLALQEVDRNQPRSSGADLTAVAAEAMGAPEHRFVAALHGSPGATWSAATGEEQPDAAAYGIALLTKHPVTSWEEVRLPPAPVPVPIRFRGRTLPALVRDEPRVGIAAHVCTPGGELTVVNTHLSFVHWWNGRQLARLVGAVEALPRPLLLCGDLNMGAERAARITRMTPAGRVDTFPWDAPREQLDHVLTDPPLRAQVSVCRMPISDHLAYVVELPDLVC